MSNIEIKLQMADECFSMLMVLPGDELNDRDILAFVFGEANKVIKQYYKNKEEALDKGNTGGD